MKFLIDEDCPYSLLEIFKKHGHEALHVRDIMRSAADGRIFEYANKNGLIIVTRDLGFGNLFIKNKGEGLLLSRLPYYFTADKMKKAFDKFLEEIDTGILSNSITVLELNRYRTRKI